MKEYETLNDAEWEKLKHLFPVPQKRGRGKPHTPWRSVVNSVLIVLLAKAKWGCWPQNEEYSSKSAAHRWYLHWEKNGLLEEILNIVKSMRPDSPVIMPQRRVHSIREVISVEESTLEVPLYMDVEKRDSTNIKAE